MFSQPLLRKKMSESDGLFRRFSQDCLFEGLNIVYVFVSLSLRLTHTHTQKTTTNRSLLRDPCNATTIRSHCQGLYETIPETYVVFEYEYDTLIHSITITSLDHRHGNAGQISRTRHCLHVYVIHVRRKQVKQRFCK